MVWKMLKCWWEQSPLISVLLLTTQKNSKCPFFCALPSNHLHILSVLLAAKSIYTAATAVKSTATMLLFSILCFINNLYSEASVTWLVHFVWKKCQSTHKTALFLWTFTEFKILCAESLSQQRHLISTFMIPIISQLHFPSFNSSPHTII